MFFLNSLCLLNYTEKLMFNINDKLTVASFSEIKTTKTSAAYILFSSPFQLEP